MNLSFHGTIKSGKLLLDQKADFQSHLHTLEGKRVEVTVEKYRKRRSLPQNAYLHGVIIPMIAKETGQDPETVKGFLKQEFGAKILFADRWIPKPTHKMDTIEMTELVERSRVWAAEFLKIVIPEPGEVMV